MIGALLCIGHELICGRIVNENAKLAGEVLSAYGFKLGEVVVVPDEISLIVKALRRLVDEYEFLIVSGGLGPTDDDLTVAAVSQAFSLELEENREVLLALLKAKDYVQSFDLAKRLALLPKGSVSLSPDLTMAGFKLTLKGKPIFFLPGVPSQFESLLKNKVLPELLNLWPEAKGEEIVILRFFDLNETDLNTFLRNFLGDVAKEELKKNVELGFYPEDPEVKLILHGEKEAIREVKKGLQEKFRFQFLGEGDKSLPVVLGELLFERGIKVATAESCTGGKLASLITSVPGSSNYFDRGFVVYSEKSKVEILGVSEETIKKYSVYSHETALEMAEKTLVKSKADFSLATTGIAGPTGGTDDLPVGTVFIALGTKTKAISVRFKFTGKRSYIQKIASYTALDMLRRYLVYGEGLSCYRFALEFKERSL